MPQLSARGRRQCPRQGSATTWHRHPGPVGWRSLRVERRAHRMPVVCDSWSDSAASCCTSGKTQIAASASARNVNSARCAAPGVDASPTARPRSVSGHNDRQSSHRLVIDHELPFLTAPTAPKLPHPPHQRGPAPRLRSRHRSRHWPGPAGTVRRRSGQARHPVVRVQPGMRVRPLVVMVFAFVVMRMVLRRRAVHLLALA